MPVPRVCQNTLQNPPTRVLSRISIETITTSTAAALHIHPTRPVVARDIAGGQVSLMERSPLREYTIIVARNSMLLNGCVA